MPIHNFKVEYAFHPVRQGLFASGCLRETPSKTNQTFHWVFDCGGSCDSIHGSVSEYKRRIGDNFLNLLCISHFDEDHVNGVVDLLNDRTPNIIVIPHITPLERLILAVERGSLSSSYIDFLSNPIAFLLENAPHVEEIYIVCRDSDIGDDGYLMYDDDISDRPIDNDKVKGKDLKPSETEELKPKRDDSTVKIPKKAEDKLKELLGKENYSKLKFVKNFEFSLNHYWEFIFYHNRKETCKSLSSIFRKEYSTIFSRKGIDLASILNKSESMDELKKWYTSLLKKVKIASVDRKQKSKSKEKYDTSRTNVSGLSMYAGPLGDVSAYINFNVLGCTLSLLYPFYARDIRLCRAIRRNHDENCPCACLNSAIPHRIPRTNSLLQSNKVSIFYAGDTRLRYADELQKARDYFNARSAGSWTKFSIFQVPHHGSKYNLSHGQSIIYRFFRNNWSVFSAQPSGSYSHPDLEIVNVLSDYNPILVDECLAHWNGEVSVNIP